MIAGGSGINIVPESCRASVDIRLLPGQSWEAVYAAVQGCVKSAVTAVPGITWSFEERPFNDPSFVTAPDHALVRSALLVSGEAKPRVVAFSCDASKVAAAGVPCIILGPGDIAEAHTSRESIGVDELEAAIAQYAELAQRLLKRKTGGERP